MEGDFLSILLRAVFAGWLIALMVWLLPFAETSRIWVIIIITYFVGLGDLSHIIAGSVETLYAVAAHTASWAEFFGRFFLPTIVAFAVFLLIKAMNSMRREPEAAPGPTTRNCPFCATSIPVEAVRCPNHTSELQSK